MTTADIFPNDTKVALAGDLQTVISDGERVRHEIVPKGTICDVIKSEPGKLINNRIYKLGLYGETFFASDIDLEEVNHDK